MALTAAVVAPFLLGAGQAGAQSYGTLVNDGATDGYTLFHSFRGTGVYLIDNDGRLINEWVEPDGYSSGSGAYLTEQGTLVRAVNNGLPVSEVAPDECSPGVDTDPDADGVQSDYCNNPTFGAGGGLGGLIREYSWRNEVLWEFEHNTVFDADLNPNAVATHHDFQKLKNGRFLIISYETIPTEECMAAGLVNAAAPQIGETRPTEPFTACNQTTVNDEGVVESVTPWIRTEQIIEVKPNYRKWSKSRITWKWRLFDHALKEGQDPGEHPERWDARNGWANFNAIDYSETYKQILISCNACNELFVIQRKVSRKERKLGKDGLVYRWGNPANYGLGAPGGFGGGGDQQLGLQHGVRFIKRFDTYGWALAKRKQGGAEANGVGKIQMFNNQYSNLAGATPPPFSAAVEIEIPRDWRGRYSRVDGEAYGPEAPSAVIDSYTTDNSTLTGRFFSPFLSNAQRLPNGHTFINSGAQGTFIEVDADGAAVWAYRSPMATTNPGGTAGGDKPGEVCISPSGLLPDGSPVPGNLNGFGAQMTTWSFRADKYSPHFRGFHKKHMAPGAVLCGTEPVTEVASGD